MDIKITCRACERKYPLTMALDPEGRPGHCPLCGRVLAFQYTPTFVSTAEATIAAGHNFVRQLTLFAEIAGGFALDPESVLEAVRDALGAQDSLIHEPYREGWPPKMNEPVI